VLSFWSPASEPAHRPNSLHNRRGRAQNVADPTRQRDASMMGVLSRGIEVGPRPGAGRAQVDTAALRRPRRGTVVPGQTKTGEKKYRWFVERYGHRCWELDALSPATLRDVVEQGIASRIDWPPGRRTSSRGWLSCGSFARSSVAGRVFLGRPRNELALVREAARSRSATHRIPR
jgi:hypothetical protein